MASVKYNRSVQFVAERYGISDPRVRTLFRNGEIDCINIADSTSDRAVYRTSDAALLDWERSRAVTDAKRHARLRRSRKKPENAFSH
ncbi:hypothetical protein Fuma_00899 [Fuerstiella marisgermanici]|uniref:Uncharacterized protein n=1 Tax=Fuerstiella marisgermanici TaxID=1891926 RepID=A0A1P8WB88_9PLAN|nr:hypothetical protein Fuma_00899 [Fuerstiella marisgermanici]